ncbi:MAG: hypothetical protein H0V19_07280 [Euzebyales bacterium]|nr:hypothetical protein [Euzebyales bacterium]
MRAAVRAHPVHRDPQLGDLEVWARRTDELRSDTERLERSVRRRTGSLVRAFDRIVGVLADLRYLSDDGMDPQPTADGMMLAGLYAETDLVLGEALRRGVLERLDPADLAAVASVFVHETRTKEPPPVGFPTPAVRATVSACVDVWQDIAAREEAAGLTTTRPLDGGFAEAVWHWASGADLDEALAGSEMTAGDFVRSAKQVADLLRQLRDVRRGSQLSHTAHAAAGAVVRGIVAYSGL